MFLDKRQIYLKTGAILGGANRPYAPMVRNGYNEIRNRQPKASAARIVLGGIERIKNFRQLFLCHTRAII